MSYTNLQEHREALRARLLADEKVRDRIAFRAFEIYQRHGDGHGGALNNWLRAEEEVISSLIDQEFQLSSASRGPKRLTVNLGETPKPRVKSVKKAQSRAASHSDTSSTRNAMTKEITPTTFAKTVKDEISTAGAAKKPSGTGVKRKERSKSESRSI
jgi:hypothetical protein